jgi:tetratricopeptide (TPR) repeat protein
LTPPQLQTFDRPEIRADSRVPDTTTEKTSTLDAALALTERLLATDSSLAAVQAEEILRVVPGHPKAQLLLAMARHAQGDLAAARAILEPLAKAQPKVAAIHFELGVVLGQLGETAPAIAALAHATVLAPNHPNAWRELGDQLTIAGETEKAEAAYARHIKASVNNPELLAAASALIENKLAVAERLLRDYLKRNPTDVAAIRMLGETGSRLGRYEDAENLLARALELAPDFAEARANYAGVLFRANKPAQAVEQAEILLRRDPRNPGYRNLIAAALSRLGENDRALEVYAGVLKDYPNQPKGWMSYGHTLKAVGRQDDSIAAYRKSITQLPSLGEAWWSLANLKTFRFSGGDVAGMEAQLARSDITEEDRYHLHFALGKAFEDNARYPESFAHYEEGNALRKKRVAYDEDETAEHLRRSKALFTREFFADRAGAGSGARDPIFIVGLPRSGSTLLEQILSSHSAVEGTMELPDILSIAGRLGARKKRGGHSAYPEKLLELEPHQFAELGEEYLARTRIQRRLDRPFFTDKMPNNFAHVGLIHLILPNAKIIDARRHPLGCCFSNFKQHFARGQGFTYDLAGMGRYYRDYVELMAHFDAVLPGRIHRVIYEEMVGNPEREVRALLDYCGLPFEDGCLRFYENERTVRTASSEQVRQPIYRDAVEHWQNYEAWLDPLKEALGPVLISYPGVPEF